MEESRGSSTSIPAGIFNLANTIMGASLTGLPYVARISGIVPYLVFMSLSVAVGYCTICFLISCVHYVPGNKKDFQQVGTAAMGESGKRLTAFATCLSCYGALIAYFVLTGLQGQIMFEMVGLSAPPPLAIQISIATFVILPLSCLRDISKLAPTSLVAIMVFAGVAFMAVYTYLTQDNFYTKPRKFPMLDAPDTEGFRFFPEELTWASMSQFPTILMAFNCQYAFLPTVEAFDSNRVADMRKVGLGGLLSAYSVYVVLGLCAYMTYGGKTEDIVLLNFRHCHHECENIATIPNPPSRSIWEWAGEHWPAQYPEPVCPADHIAYRCHDDNPFVNMLNGLFLFAVLMGYPCVHFSCRKAQIALTFGLDSEFDWRVHIGIAVFNIVITLGIAMAVGTDVSLVFRWTGAIASPLLSFVLPALFYFMLLGKAGHSIRSGKRLLPLLVLFYGSLLICFCVLCQLKG